MTPTNPHTSKAYWFPCYANDLLSSMRWKCMTPAERGAYWQLICWQMQSEDGHLPKQLSALSGLADYPVDPGSMLDEAFPEQENGRRANARALREWTKRATINQKRSDACAKAARARWDADSMRDACTTDASRMRELCTYTPTPTDTHRETSNESLTPAKADVCAWWNDTARASGLSAIRSMTAGRWRKFTARHKEGLWDARKAIAEAIAASDFVKTGSWCSFDWVCENDTNWQKLIEGKYADKKPAKAKASEGRLQL